MNSMCTSELEKLLTEGDAQPMNQFQPANKLPCDQATADFGLNELSTLDLPSQNAQYFDDNFDMNDFLNVGEVEESSTMGVQDSTFLELSLPECNKPTTFLGVEKRNTSNTRKTTDTTSNAPKPKKRKDRTGEKKSSDSSKMKKTASSKQLESSSVDVSLFSFIPLQNCGDQKKKAKCRLNKARATIKSCEDSDRENDINEVALDELNDKIALARVELEKMCENANGIRLKITRHNQNRNRLRTQAESELEESTRLYDSLSSMEIKLRREFDRIFQSDSD